MQNKETIPLLIEKLSKDFNLEKDNLPVNSDLEKIREYFIKKITEMMEKDFERLLNSLYRIDLSEDKVQKVFYGEEKTNIPEKLADLIIERQMQRVKTQILYKQGKL